MKNKGYGLVFVIALFIGIIGTFFTLKYIGLLDERIVEVDKTITTVNIVESDKLKKSIDKIYNSVVFIESYRKTATKGTGSGFFYKQDNKYGYILTNQHVINNSNKVEITNIEGETYEAEILGSDEYSDIAVLRVEKKAVLGIAILGSNDNTELGDTVFTVGSPLGKDYIGSVTKGIISGKNRKLTTSKKYVTEVLQVDAALNPGNSGGPLVDINGEVIGINSLKLAEEEVEGMGFAIPIEIVKTIASKLEKQESVDRPIFGITMAEVDSTYQLYKYGIILDDSIDKGVVVVEVQKNTPAEAAKLKKGDVVLAINNNDVADIAYFRAELYKYNVGDNITVKYLRDNKIKEVTVKLDVKMETNN